MGIGLGKRCYTNPSNPSAVAPNPNPSRWELLKYVQFDNCYLLTVRYLDCTNFEGTKILLFAGKYYYRESLDPHFSENDDSPIARFKPTEEGIRLAISAAENFK